MNGNRLKALLGTVALIALVVALLAAAVAFADEIEYAAQGDARVYQNSDTLLCGLETLSGEKLTDAVYSEIQPFSGGFAVFVRGDKQGVMDMTGAEVISPRHDNMYLEADHNCAIGIDTETAITVYDLRDMSVFRSGNDFSCGVSGPYFGFTDGRDMFDTEPPYKTEIYDRELNHLFTVDAQITDYDEETGLFRAWLNDGSRGLIDAQGNAALSGCDWIEYSGGAYIYGRSEKNAVAAALENAGYSRDHIIHAFMRRGVTMDDAERVTMPLEDISYVGVWRADGAAFETIGKDISGPDSEGLYAVQYSGYRYIQSEYSKSGYMDESGEWALAPQYVNAYPFVDGAAVVRLTCNTDNADTENDTLGEMALIDRQGNRIESVPFGYGNEGFYANAMFERAVFPVMTDGAGTYLMDRSGALVGDEVFAHITQVIGDYLLGEDLDGSTCLIDASGAVVLREKTEGWTIYGETQMLFFTKDSTAHYVDLSGGAPAVVDTLFADINPVELTATTADGKTVYINKNYEPIGCRYVVADGWDCW